MPAAAAHHPNAGQSYPRPVYPNDARPKPTDVRDLEPDEEWKTALHKRIESELMHMFSDAESQCQTELAKGPRTRTEEERILREHREAQANIRSLAMEQYHYELKKERNQRRWLAGLPVDDPEWAEIFAREQQEIMEKIKRDAQKESNAAKVEARTSTPPVASSPSPRPSVTPSQESAPARPSPLSTASRASEAHRNIESSSSRDLEETRRTGSISRRSTTTRERPSIPIPVPKAVVVEQDDAMLSPPTSHIPPPSTSPSSSRQRPSDKMSASPNERVEGSLGRSSGSIRSVRSDRSIARSSPAPEMWKPTINTAEDDVSPATPPPAPPPITSSAKPSNLGRRGSTASIRSTGSGASIRPSITETIPERDVIEDDGPDLVERPVQQTEQQQHQSTHGSGTSSKRKLSVKRPQRRRDSKSSIPETHEPPQQARPLRPPSTGASGSSSATMHYAMSSSPVQSSSKGDSHPSRILSPSGSSGSFSPSDYHAMKSSPYNEGHYSPSPRSAPRDREHGPVYSSYPARSAQQQSRPSYVDDYEYGPPSGRGGPPLSPYNDRDSRDYLPSGTPMSHKSSFYYGRDRDRDRDWDWNNDERMPPRERDVDYHEHYDPPPPPPPPPPPRSSHNQRYSGGPYGPPRGGPGYPTPPSSAGRHGASMEYLPMNELYDDRDRDWEPQPPPPRDREHGYSYYHRPPNDDYEYARSPDNPPTRPLGPMRQPSYSRRESDESKDSSAGRRMTSGDYIVILNHHRHYIVKVTYTMF
ncbi:hypothetical protein CPC08DRAFT_166125 [Agrocybe pediades]|nr:hypothetical protein CPC08DRAFT_166125 [Agrocybe pediades]